MAKQVEVPEYEVQDRVQVDAAHAALIVVDMQNDFVDPQGALFVPTSRETIPAIQRLLAKARQAGALVVFTQDWHAPDDPEFAIWGKHAVADTWGSEVIPELAPAEGELRVHKEQYDAFFGTDLDALLRERGVQDVIVCGTVANICVHYTAASAALRGYRVILPRDAISALTPFDMEATLRQTSWLFRGAVTTVDGIAIT
ncbi:MAG: cysteine hydrolase [Anaerolineae bacterium]|nr:cysteine hydrolase [Anaerolineae bacterium]